MVNRVVCVTLLVLLTAIHAQLWLGNGSMAYVRELQQQIDDQYAANALEKSENDRLQSEVNDLKDGLSTVEEKARYELGMVKPNEIYIQVSRR
ncbi:MULTISPECIES: septum formation initiator family protein [Comamonas]|jgi:cell division protein FtsB|uniref:septum formation initiator family protein n=1 Tax=Comamonas TaxID=283 RepID=UPI0012D20D77|nr:MULTISPECIES: septum formation initiator family protein [Comamonas]MDR3066416.1 septum formation initiator family protein [Comamonas sp.]MEB5965416.1 septum formation initiator family protein [Comamonas testosteroni]MPS96428.1 septation ring formation regulator EzrA [Comamonas sp.]